MCFILIKMAPVKKRRFCPNSKYCECDFENKRIECICQLNECKNMGNSFDFDHTNNVINNHVLNNKSLNFANMNLVMFKEIYINSVTRIDSEFFKNSIFMSDFRLSLQSIKFIEPFILASVNNLQVCFIFGIYA